MPGLDAKTDMSLPAQLRNPSVCFLWGRKPEDILGEGESASLNSSAQINPKDQIDPMYEEKKFVKLFNEVQNPKTKLERLAEISWKYYRDTRNLSCLSNEDTFSSYIQQVMVKVLINRVDRELMPLALKDQKKYNNALSVIFDKIHPNVVNELLSKTQLQDSMAQPHIIKYLRGEYAYKKHPHLKPSNSLNYREMLKFLLTYRTDNQKIAHFAFKILLDLRKNDFFMSAKKDLDKGEINQIVTNPSICWEIREKLIQNPLVSDESLMMVITQPVFSGARLGMLNERSNDLTLDILCSRKGYTKGETKLIKKSAI